MKSVQHPITNNYRQASIFLIGLSLFITTVATTSAQTLDANNLKAMQADLSDPAVTQPEAEQFKLLERQEGQVWQKERLEKEISNVRVIYRGQLETYRAQEKAFKIAQDQYKSLQTLDSIEQAVKSTRQAMLSRDQVLFTYLTLLKLRLIDGEGVEISYKQLILDRIEVLLAQLEKHHAQVLKEHDRQKINALSDDFLQLGIDVRTVASHSLAALNLGKLQSVYDRGVLLFDEIQAEVANFDGKLTEAEKNRAVIETQRTLDKTSTSLKILTGKVGQRLDDKSEIYSESDMSGNLNTIYGNLSKVLGYFAELLKRSAE